MYELLVLLVLVIGQGVLGSSITDRTCVPAREEIDDFYTLYHHGKSTGVNFVNQLRNRSIQARQLRSTTRDVVVVTHYSDFFRLLQLGAQAEASLLLEVIGGNFNGIFGHRSFKSVRKNSATVVVYYKKNLLMEYVQPCGPDVTEYGNFDLLTFENEDPIGNYFVTGKKKGLLVMILIEIVNMNATSTNSYDGSLEVGVSTLLSKVISGSISGSGNYTEGVNISNIHVSVEMVTVGDIVMRKQAPTSLVDVASYIETEFPYFDSLNTGAYDLEYCLSDIRILKKCRIHDVNNFTTPVFRQDHVIILKSIVDQISVNMENAASLNERVQRMQDCLPEVQIRGLNQSFGLFNLFRAKLNFNVSRDLNQYMDGKVSEDDFLNLLTYTYHRVSNELQIFDSEHRNVSPVTTKYMSLFEILAQNRISCWPRAIDMNVVRFSACKAPYHLLFDKSNMTTLEFSEITQDFLDECKRCRKQCFLVNCEASNVDCTYYKELPVAVYYPSNSSATAGGRLSYLDIGACAFNSIMGHEFCTPSESDVSRISSYKYFFKPSIFGTTCNSESLRDSREKECSFNMY